MDSLNKTFETDTYKNKTKIKVESAEIVVHGNIDKPYYEIKYLVVGENEYRIGYSSYDINNVFGWLEECFEIVTTSIPNPLQKSSVYMNYIISWIMYFVGFVIYIVFISLANGISDEAWLYALGASIGVLIITLSEYLRQ